MRQSQGQFRYGARNTSHVEVDGRLITGMNWQSTRDVVKAVIKQLDQAGSVAVK